MVKPDRVSVFKHVVALFNIVVPLTNNVESIVVAPVINSFAIVFKTLHVNVPDTFKLFKHVVALLKIVIPDTFKLLYINVLFAVFIIIPAAFPLDCNIKLFILLKIVSPVEDDDEKLPGVDAIPKLLPFALPNCKFGLLLLFPIIVV